MSNALLLSASRADNTGYLEHATPMIQAFIESLNLTKRPTILFVPYAGVSITFDAYFDSVKTALSSLNVNFESIHKANDPIDAVAKADVMLVGGGNTFSLLNQLYANNLIEPIQQRVKSGMAYIGWSAGSNIAGLSIKTTNDMPIVEPPSFNALAILPMQLNPHYTDYQAPGHNGETREMRLNEFMIANPELPVIGIQEGSALLLSNGTSLTLIGQKPGYLFHSLNKIEVPAGHDFSDMIKAPHV